MRDTRAEIARAIYKIATSQAPLPVTRPVSSTSPLDRLLPAKPMHAVAAEARASQREIGRLQDRARGMRGQTVGGLGGGTTPNLNELMERARALQR